MQRALLQLKIMFVPISNAEMLKLLYQVSLLISSVRNGVTVK